MLLISLTTTFSMNLYVATPTVHACDKCNFLLAWGSSVRRSGNGQFNNPQGIAIDSTGNIYVVDYGNYRVQKFDSSGTYITQWGSHGSGNGQFRDADGLAVDSSGNVYVADGGNYRVQKFTSDGTYLTQWGSYGSSNGQFRNGDGVAVDSNGNVYVADTNNNRVQKFSSDGKYLTQWGSYGDAGTGQFSYPHGIAADSSGNVYITNWGDDRVQKFGDSTPSDLSRSLWTQYSQPYLILPIILVGIIMGVVLNRRRSKAKESLLP